MTMGPVFRRTRSRCANASVTKFSWCCRAHRGRQRRRFSLKSRASTGSPQGFQDSGAAGTQSLETDGGDDVVDRLLELGVLLQDGLDLLDGVEDGGVVLAPEAAADVRVGMAGELAGEIHG